MKFYLKHFNALSMLSKALLGGTEAPELKAGRIESPLCELPSTFLGGAAEALTPVTRRCGMTQSRLLHLQQHGVERGEVANPDDKVEQCLAVLALCVEP